MMQTTENIKRKFIVGSEWLSYKLYMGTQTADVFIKEQLFEVVDPLLKNGDIDRWFFVRYADPELHVRVRFRLKNPAKINRITTAVYNAIKSLSDNRLIHKVTIDTYVRELERYGFDTIEESERLFHINSNLIIDVLKLVGDDEHKRWLWGAKTIDTLLDAFDYDLLQKKELLLEMKHDFGQEFGMNKAIRKQLSMKFRTHRKDISMLIQNSEIDTALSPYSNHYKEVSNSIAASMRKENQILSCNNLLYSYIHMHCNRLFPSKQRMNEWVLYDLLYQYYYSEHARKRSIQLKRKS